MMHSKQLIIFTFCMIAAIFLSGQDYAYRTFKDTRIINTHSVETLPKRKLDVRIGHRFGDLFGENGGWTTFYGLETARDVMIGVDYGLTNNLTIGGFRTKGAGDLRQNLNGIVKYRLLRETNSQPSSVSMTALGMASISTMERSATENTLTRFDKSTHRIVYTTQLLISKRFSNNFALQLTPSYTHRNIVDFNDVNGIFSLGTAARLQVTKVIGILVDATIPLNSDRSPFVDGEGEGIEYGIPLGFGIEFDTGGHVFQINFTNAEGIMETDYIPNTTGDWLDGQFRLGFTISRLFNL